MPEEATVLVMRRKRPAQSAEPEKIISVSVLGGAVKKSKQINGLLSLKIYCLKTKTMYTTPIFRSANLRYSNQLKATPASASGYVR